MTPLSVTLQTTLTTNTGFTINPVASRYMGESKTTSQYQPGLLVNDTVLRMQTWSLRMAYLLGRNTAFDALLGIGSDTIPALANTMPASYGVSDPSGLWTDTAVSYGAQLGVTALPGPANAGYAIAGNTGAGQQATWYPYNSTNPNAEIASWGYIRLHALQAWNEFNWNGDSTTSAPVYEEFTDSFNTVGAFMSTSNPNITTLVNSTTFLDRVYSNMDDLMTGDVAGVNMATWDFGTDLYNTGNAIDLTNIDKFGLPSVLFMTIIRNHAMDDDLLLALLATGMTVTEIQGICEGTDAPTIAQEQQLFTAMGQVRGEPLKSILSRLGCTTAGITTLADLLDIRKLFPNSYQSMTVPIYRPTDNRSKTYLLIYSDGGINSQLTSPDVAKTIGTRIVATPVGNQTGVGLKELPVGYGSYLYGILPQDLATTAGAFSYTMLQIKGIMNVSDTRRFARVIQSLETTANLPLLDMDTPVDQQSLQEAIAKVALGSGKDGIYTYSDFFGSMSGLPYRWKAIYELIRTLQTTALANIYRENYLAVTWQVPTLSVVTESRSQEVSPGVFETQYRVASVTVTNPGGGYGRGGAPAPTVTSTDSTTFAVTIGTNDADVGPSGSFGRITSLTITSPGTWGTSVPVVTIQSPPVSATGGANSPSTTTSIPDSVVTGYVAQANAEILNISRTKVRDSTILNQYWDICGSQLMREQRARYHALQPVEITQPASTSAIRKSLFGSFNNVYAFAQSIADYAQDTYPHGAAQTLEAIADTSTLAGQAIVGAMREARNKLRLSATGVEVDSEVPSDLDDDSKRELLANGTTSSTVGIKGQCNTFTIPSWHSTYVGNANTDLTPLPRYYCASGMLYESGELVQGSLDGILNDCSNVSAMTMVATPTNIPITGGNQDDPYVAAIPEYLDPTLPYNLDMSYTSSTLLVGTDTPATAQITVTQCKCWRG